MAVPPRYLETTGGTADGSPGSRANVGIRMPRIAVFTKNRSNPAYEAARLGADRTAARLGATTAHYVPEVPDSAPEQIALIARAIDERPDAAVFVPAHETAVNDAILEFDSAGIPLFNIITPTTAGQRVTFIGSDDRALARDIARYLFGKLGGRGEIVIVEGAPSSATSHARRKGFDDALAEHPGIRMRLSLPGEYQRDAARKAFLDAKAHWRGLAAVLCANDAMALGVLDVLEAEAGPGLPVVGVNAIPEAVAAIAAGRMLATANFDAMAMSELATEAAVRHLRGEKVPAEVMLPVQVVDAGNCARWNAPFAARPSPDWATVVGAKS
jgi:ribose transport system substrate-binding protein